MARKVSADARAGLSVVLAAGLSLAGCAAPGNRDAAATGGPSPRDIQTSDAGTGIRFGASATGGCVHGSVGLDGTVQVVAGGYIMDGGCLAMNGH